MGRAKHWELLILRSSSESFQPVMAAINALLLASQERTYRLSTPRIVLAEPVLQEIITSIVQSDFVRLKLFLENPGPSWSNGRARPYGS